MAVEKKNGFTLVEILMVVIAVGIIAGVTAKVLISGLDVYSLVVNRTSAVQSARESMERLFEEISTLTPATLLYMNSDEIGFYDRGFNYANFRLQYCGGSLCLYRAGDFMLKNVQNLTFSYLDANDAMAWWPSDVRKVVVNMTVGDEGGHGNIRLRTTVFLKRIFYADFE